MRILFLIPTFGSKARYHPGIASLSAVLKEKGHETDLIEPNSLDMAFLKDRIKKHSPDLIAISTNSHQYHYAKMIIPYIRGNFPNIKIILGGVHPTLDGEVINDIEGLDALCRGEGEQPLLKYIESISSDRKDYDIPNTLLRTKEGIRKNRISYYVEDLDSLPLPDYTIFPLFGNSGRLNFPMRFLFNRGCPFNCTYCCNHEFKELFPQGARYVRYKSPGRAIEELLYFSDRYEFDHYVVDDDVFTLNKKWLLEFCSLYPKRLKGKTFEANVRVGTADREVLKALKDIGCNLIKVGIESGNEEVRRQILGRGISQDKIIQTADTIRSLGLKLHTFNMIGIPKETRLDVWDTIRLNRRIRPAKTQLTVFYPYKNTKLGDYCIKKKLFKKNHADSYFTESILRSSPFLLTGFEIRHFVNFFKFYVYLGNDNRKAWKSFLKGMRGYLSNLKRFFKR